MRRKERQNGAEQEQEEAPEQAYRITWSHGDFARGRWVVCQMVQYARSESLAVNQALAKIRFDYPNGVVTACEPVISRSPVTARAGGQEPDPTRGASGG